MIYDIRYTINEDPARIEQDVDNPYTIRGIKKDDTVQIWVSAANNLQKSPEVVTSVKMEKPSSLPKIDIIGTTATTISVRWNEVANASDYDVTYRLKNASEIIDSGEVSSLPDISFIIKNLEPETEYEIEVVARNLFGKGEPSVPKTGKTVQIVEPTNLSWTSTDRLIDLNWDAVDGATHYDIYWTEGDVFNSNPEKTILAEDSPLVEDKIR